MRTTFVIAAVIAAVALFVTTTADFAAPTQSQPESSPSYQRLLEATTERMDGSILDEVVDAEERALVWNPISASLTSGCWGSGCLGSGCGGSGCLGSGCGGSGCAGSACLGSGCFGSTCTGSGCHGSVCLGSGCAGSVCLSASCKTNNAGQKTAAISAGSWWEGLAAD